MSIFEVILPGFDGASDETDNLVLLVQSDSIKKVQKKYPKAEIYLLTDELLISSSAIDEIIL